MKRFAFFFLLAILLSACSSNTPRGIAAKFMDALMAGDFEKAKIYSTPETGAVIEFLKNAPITNTALGYTIVEEKISEDGNSAVVKFSVTQKDGKEETNSLDLVKIDDKWKVRMTIKKK